MPPEKKKKKVSKSDSDSSGSEEVEDVKPAKEAKSTKKRSKDDDDDDEPSWHLGNKRFAKVRSFRGKLMIDIREFYEDNGEMKPGKKGICLQVAQWKKLCEIMPEIEDAVKERA
uniref:Putative rna polymerase ii transcriptional coactivator n=1 Tax=Panstrongylus megistus TaxID=65343 RepID=A0A069DP17_9HEMI